MDRLAITTVGVLVFLALGSGLVSSAAVADSGGQSLSDHTNITSAKPVSDGTYDIDVPGTGSIYYEINLSDKEQVNFTTSGSDQAVELTLVAPDQVTELRTKSGSNEIADERDATLVYTANQNATFYLEVSTTNDSPTNASLLVSSPDLTDRLEPNDDIESSAAISDGRTNDLQLAGSELDYYAVSLNDSEQMTVATENASQALRVRVIAPDRVTELRSASGGTGIGDDRDASVTYTANQDATFYVEIDSTNDRSTGYSLTLTTPNLTDRLEPNDGFRSAVALSDGQTNDLQLAGSELDYYTVTLNSSEQVTFATEGASQALRVRLFGPDQVTELRSASGGNLATDERDASITYTSNQNATFYVEVDSTNDRSTGYSVELTTPNLTDKLEPNDRITGAAALSDGRTEDLQLAGAELDYYAVSLNDSEQVTFETEGASRPVRVKMFAPDRTTLLRSARGEAFFGTDDRDAGVTYTANRDGTFYFSVTSINNRSTGYAVNVQTPDLTDRLEPNDEFQSAPFTDIGRYQDLHVAGNESDYYRVSLGASQELTARLEGENQNLVVRLYDASGTVLASGEFESGGFFSGDSPPEVTYTVETAGTYYVEANSKNNRSSDYTLVVDSNQSITETNVAPVAEAGDDSTVNQSASVTLDASGSTDPNTGDSLTYTWTQVSGPSVTLSGDGVTRTFTAPDANTTLTFEVTVSDGNLTASDTTTVTVGQPQPSGPDVPGVSSEVASVVAGADGSVDRSDILDMVQGYLTGGAVDGVSVTRDDVLAMVQYYLLN